MNQPIADFAETTLSVHDAIFGRRSVRSYAKTPLPRALLQALLAAAVRAPTAMHNEPWQFVVIEDSALLKRLSSQARESFVAATARLHPGRPRLEVFSKPGFNIFYDAPALVIICAQTDATFAAADCWLAAQNLMLQAHALGLGSCIIGSAVDGLNAPATKLELGIPAATRVFAPIIVGTPRSASQPSERNAPQVLAWL